MESKNPIGTKRDSCAHQSSESFATAKCYESEGNQSSRLCAHLAAGDYFAFLATVIGFVEDVCIEHERKGYQTAPMTSEEFRKFRSELIYLQHHYGIVQNKVLMQEKDA